jgi:hypothetical protein
MGHDKENAYGQAECPRVDYVAEHPRGRSPETSGIVPCLQLPLGAYRRRHLLRVVRCARCGAKHHEPCFWRMLPLEEWVEYIQWAMETNEERRKRRTRRAAR